MFQFCSLSALHDCFFDQDNYFWTGDTIRLLPQACTRDIKDCNWLLTWIGLAKKFAFCYNPALQPRALIVYGCICKLYRVFRFLPMVYFCCFVWSLSSFSVLQGRTIKDEDIRQLLRILEKALEKSSDLTLIEAPVVCLTRLEQLIRQVKSDLNHWRENASAESYIFRIIYPNKSVIVRTGVVASRIFILGWRIRSAVGKRTTVRKRTRSYRTKFTHSGFARHLRSYGKLWKWWHWVCFSQYRISF